jgi:diacylglycerol kinase family enzyme
VLASRYTPVVMVPPDAKAMDSAVREAVSADPAAIVIAGGDGTLNRVVNALDGADVPIGLLPIGTGNDFARAMCVPRSAEAAARLIVAGRTRRVDLASVNGRAFATAGLLGVPALATMSVRRWFSPNARTRPLLHVLGGAAYSLAGLRHLLHTHVAVARYTIDASCRVARSPHPANGVCSASRIQDPAPLSLRAHGMFVVNTRVLGGGLVLPLESDDADGSMEIAAIPEMPRGRLLWAFACFARGWRLPVGVLHVIRTPHAAVTCEAAEPFAADGDLMCEADRFDVRVLPRQLTVFCGWPPRVHPRPEARR